MIHIIHKKEKKNHSKNLGNDECFLLSFFGLTGSESESLLEIGGGVEMKMAMYLRIYGERGGLFLCYSGNGSRRGGGKGRGGGNKYLWGFRTLGYMEFDFCPQPASIA